MSNTQERDARYQRAEQALEEYFALVESPSGAGPSFEAFVAQHPDLAAELRELHGLCGEVDQVLERGQESFSARQTEIQEMLSGLDSPEFAQRYAVEGEVGKGGMGAVYRVIDRKLDRPLAMKVILGQAEASRTGKTPPLAPRQLARFLNEAKITGQLDHPGIVPVHEVGVDQEGRAYFTMKLVKGRTLGEVFEARAANNPEWSTARVLNVIQRVCEALAFAHDRGVIHRDLKPANVMVGDFGEVYVMDWGLARRLDEGEQVTPAEAAVEEELSAQLSLTREGQLLGTPAYMSPEQASGKLSEIGPASDVYALGAMLYQLIAGHPPYSKAGEHPSAATVIARILQGPPMPLVAPDTPPELIAICQKAMARDPRQRYPNPPALATDLTAFLTGRAVQAFRTGPWVELTKWVQRNRPLATALASSVTLIVTVVAGFTLTLSRKSRDLTKANESLELKSTESEQRRVAAEESERRTLGEKERADREAEEATRKRDEVLRLSALQDVDDLVAEVNSLWPALPENIPAFQRWIEAAEQLIGGLPEHRRIRDELRAKALPQSPDERRRERESNPQYARWLALQRELEATAETAGTATSEESARAAEDALLALERENELLSARLEERIDWSFPEGDRKARWWNYQVTKLIEGLEALERELLAEDAVTEAHGWSVSKRLAIARSIETGFGPAGEFSLIWARALPEIRAAYSGLELSPQVGLLPLGADPDTGLWEFADLQTGSPAARRADGGIALKEDTGIVFVLIPGGTFRMGAQANDPRGDNYDPLARGNEAPVHTVTLSPFFLSKYEMTQGQWMRITGVNPSYFGPSRAWGGRQHSLFHPVEQVSWRTASTVLHRMRLELPTEAQWEYAARAETSTPWWTGSEATSLAGSANLADSFAKRSGGPQDWPYELWLDDGFQLHAPVGSYSANAFGLHDVSGNVWEWCLDGYEELFYSRSPIKDPLAPPAETHVIRGGSMSYGAPMARIALRYDGSPDVKDFGLGVRPARGLTP
jgi:serine/threonine protein kinase/formylglycine-generating enzyme required for sulfatase activity